MLSHDNPHKSTNPVTWTACSWYIHSVSELVHRALGLLLFQIQMQSYTQEPTASKSDKISLKK